MIAEGIKINNNYIGEYPYSELYVPSIHSKMSEKEELLRMFIMNYIIDNNQGFNIDYLSQDMCTIIGIEYKNVEKMIAAMVEKEGFHIEDNIVKFIYPVSSVPTNNRVTLEDGRSFYAMCAIDSLGSHYTFNQNIRIESKCSKCSEAVIIEVEDGKIKSSIPKDLHILHVNMKKFKNWGNSC
ncbi:MAG: MerB-like organometallic lyase SaoL [Clostridium sp.]